MSDACVNFDKRSLVVSAFSSCVHCGSESIKKNGKAHGHQRWLCRSCGKTFSSRSSTILFSSKLKPGQIRTIVRMLADGVLMHQIAHQAGCSVQTIVLMKRKLEILAESQEKTRLSGNVWVDETYINAPVSERSPIKKRGLSKDKVQVAVAVDGNGHALAVINGRGMSGYDDARRAFGGRIEPGSTVYHDLGKYGDVFEGSKEVGILSTSEEAHRMLNPINSFCFLVQRLFAVHLRIHPQNRQKYLDELVERRGTPDYFERLEKLYGKIFRSGKTLFRRQLKERPATLS